MARRLETLFERYRRRGDAAALGKVFDRTAHEILRVAMHLTRHPAEAEDLLQETFLTAIARADAYDEERPLVPWLLGILRNHAHRLRRRRAYADRMGGPEAEDARDAWMDVAWTDTVSTAVEDLPEPYRQVLVLRLRHDRTPAEIASLLDLPPATVRSQIHRGLDRLRRRLPPDARSAALAALPMGMGLDRIREQVLTQAGRAAVATTTGAATLPIMGSLIMTKKEVLGVGLLLATLLVGGAVAVGSGLFQPPPTGPELASAPDARDGDDTSRDGGAPALQGARGATDPDLPPEDAAGSRVDTDRPIPPDKGSVAGKVVFEDGTPLAGATLALWGSPNIPAATDEEGRYHVHADWVHERGMFLRLGRADQPDWVGLILSGDVLMKAGELVRKDLVLKRGIDLEGVVVDTRDDAPIPNVQLVLRRMPLGPGQASSAFVFTDKDGRFRIPYVPRATYTLGLKREGYESALHRFDLTTDAFHGRWELAPARRLVIHLLNLPQDAIGQVVSWEFDRLDGGVFSMDGQASVAPDATITLDAPGPGRYLFLIERSEHLPRVRKTLQLEAGRAEPIEITLPKGARLEGTLRDAEGEPIANARMSIGGATDGPRTDAEGAFAFSYVPSGSRPVRVYVGNAWLRIGRVDVPEGGTARVDLVAPGASVLAGTLRVGGEPVRWTYGGLNVRLAGEKDDLAKARPGDEGRFRVPHLPAGTYEIVAWCGSGSPMAREVVLREGETFDLGVIDLRADVRIPVRLVLPFGQSMPDRVAILSTATEDDEQSGMPSTVQAGQMRWLVSPFLSRDENGDTWVGGLTPGRHRLEFLIDGLERVTVEVEARKGITEPIEIRFEVAR